MVTRPQDYISQLAQAGADFITLHPETINGTGLPPDRRDPSPRHEGRTDP